MGQNNKQYVKKIEVNGQEYEFSFRPAACRKYNQLTGKDILDWVITFNDVFGALIKTLAATLTNQLDNLDVKYEYEDAVYSFIKPGYEEYAKIIYCFLEDANPEIGTYDEWFNSLDDFPVFDFILKLYPYIAESILSKKNISELVKETLGVIEKIAGNQEEI